MRAPTPIRVRLRDLRPGEHATVQAVFDGLSPASRQLRFHGPVERLSPRMLEHLSAVDGRDHVVVVAEAGRGRRRRPVGWSVSCGRPGGHGVPGRPGLGAALPRAVG